jgi:hypothetical protein
MYAEMTERFVDRGGCGDELYGDQHFRAAAWLADLHGTALDHDSELDLVDDADDFAGH